MNRKKRVLVGIISGIFMVILIFDAKSASAAAAEALDLCIKTVIPSLFPFFVISIIINKLITGTQLRILKPFNRLFSIPEGAESLLLIGILGGYPVGAQCIYEAYRSGSIKTPDARRMLGFCNNAGPAFLFGMIQSLFATQKEVFVLWGIHLISALTVGILLPRGNVVPCRQLSNQATTLSVAIEKSIKAMCGVCGWIVVFRIISSFLEKWFLWLLPRSLAAAIIGTLELVNGCYALFSIGNPGTRFVIVSLLLSFGGLCVYMQTVSVTKELGTGYYFPGKVLQASIAFLCASLIQKVIYPSEVQWHVPDITVYIAVFTISVTTLLLKGKKVVAFQRLILYNKRNYNRI